MIVITRLFYTDFRPISGTERTLFVRGPNYVFLVAIPLISSIPLIIKRFTVLSSFSCPAQTFLTFN